MKRFQEYNINSKIIIILVSILLVNLISFSSLYFLQFKKEKESATVTRTKVITTLLTNENQNSGMHCASAAGNIQTVGILNGNIETEQENIYLISFFLITSVSCCCFCYITMKKHVVNPVQVILEKSDELASGSIPAFSDYKSGDEFGKISDSINKIIQNKTELSEFVKEIGNGKSDAEYQLLGEQDVMGHSLLSMRDKMHQIAREEAKRNWANEGVALFSEILMEEYSLQVLSDKLLSSLVKYISANQGSLFIRETDLNEEVFFELYACYAWNRKKFQNKQIYLHEGLVGQVAVEKETIFLTEIPENYISITSGLGEANPRSIIVVPLKVNDTVHGVLELASFKVFEKYEMEFIEKLAENIASTIANTKINENTKRLLDETRAMNENLQAQEEELRQNTEELNATQESLERAKDEMQRQIEGLEFERIKNEGILEGCVDAVVSFNERGMIEFYNVAAEMLWGIKKEKAIDTSIKDFISLEILNEAGDLNPYYVSDHGKEKLTSRTEINIRTNNTITPVLITVSKVRTGHGYFFTAFIQNISVELF